MGIYTLEKDHMEPKSEGLEDYVPFQMGVPSMLIFRGFPLQHTIKFTIKFKPFVGQKLTYSNHTKTRVVTGPLFPIFCWSVSASSSSSGSCSASPGTLFIIYSRRALEWWL